MPINYKYTDQQQIDRANLELARLETNLRSMQTATNAGNSINVWELKEYARRAGLNCNVLIALAKTVEREAEEKRNKEE